MKMMRSQASVLPCGLYALAALPAQQISRSSIAQRVMGGKALRCAACGSLNVVAKIEGKYYCFKCGSAVILENSKRMLQELKKKYLESSA